jgi:hypothetical protein
MKKKQTNLQTFFGVGGGPKVRSLTPLKGRSGKNEQPTTPQQTEEAPQASPAKTASSPKKRGRKDEATPSAPSTPSDKGKAARKAAPCGSAKPKTKERGRKQRKKADSDDDEFGEDDLVLYDEQADDDEEDLVLEAERSEHEEEAELMEREAPRRSAVGAARLQGLTTPRPLELQDAALAAYAPGLAKGDVKPLLSTEPEFAFDEKVHKSFVKKLKLSDAEGATAGGAVGDDVSLDSPLAAIKRRPNVKVCVQARSFCLLSWVMRALMYSPPPNAAVHAARASVPRGQGEAPRRDPLCRMWLQVQVLRR